jgi:hypothetical protein
VTVPRFTPFPVPRRPDDRPLVTHAGFDYRCTGCGGPVPDGVWIHEAVEDGMIVGMVMRDGPDGAVIHQCGQVGAGG